MRILRAAGLAALTVGVVVAAATAQKTPRGTLLPPFLYPAKPQVEETAAPPTRPEPPDRKVLLQKLEDVQQRRQRVIDELRRVALEQSDEKLLDEAEQLEQRSFALYESRSNALLRGGVLPEPKGPTVMDETREMLIKSAQKRKEGGR